MKNEKFTHITMLFFCTAILAVFSNLTVHAQSPCNPSKVITTNPSAPFNNETPALTNYFNWTNSGYPIRSLNYPSYSQIESPYYQSSNTLMTPFVNSKDMAPNDGWELIKMDLGYDQNNQPTTHLAYNPKVILYNKYTGVLRVFIARGDNYNSYNNMQISLYFDGSHFKTSALDLNRGVFPLDYPYVQSKYLSLLTVPNTPYTWMYADFPMAYDPCTCFYTSLLNIQVDYMVTANVDLAGTITGKLTSITNGSGTVNTPQTHSLGFGDIVSGAKTFVKDYKDLNSYLSDQQKNLNDPASNALLSSQTKNDILGSLTSFTNLIKQSSFLQSTLSTVPYIGAALTFLNFFTGGGNSSGPTQVQLLPVAVDLTSKVSGTISNSFLIESYPFTTPGSSISGMDQSLYPLYNQTMGVLSFISTPKIYEATCWIDDCPGCDISYGGNWYYLFRFKDPIKYVLNPAAKLKISSVKAALVIEGGQYVTSTCNVWPKASTGGSWSSNWTFEGARSDTDMTAHARIQYSQYRTDYVDAHCLNDLIAKYTYYEDDSPTGACTNALPPRNLYVKLLVDLQRLDTTATTQHVLQVYKVPVKIGSSNSYGNIYAPPYYCYDPINDCLNHETVTSPCSTDMFIPSTDAEVSSFCTSTAYTQNRLSTNPKLTMKDSVYEKSINELLINPNPATTRFYMRFNLSKYTTFTLTLYDLLGNSMKKISDKSVGDQYKTFDVSDLHDGSYFIELIAEGKRQVRKVIIQRK